MRSLRYVGLLFLLSAFTPVWPQPTLYDLVETEHYAAGASLEGLWIARETTDTEAKPRLFPLAVRSVALASFPEDEIWAVTFEGTLWHMNLRSGTAREIPLKDISPLAVESTGDRRHLLLSVLGGLVLLPSPNSTLKSSPEAPDLEHATYFQTPRNYPQLTSLAIWGRNVFAGTPDGRVLHYRLGSGIEPVGRIPARGPYIWVGRDGNLLWSTPGNGSLNVEPVAELLSRAQVEWSQAMKQYLGYELDGEFRRGMFLPTHGDNKRLRGLAASGTLTQKEIQFLRTATEDTRRVASLAGTAVTLPLGGMGLRSVGLLPRAGSRVSISSRALLVALSDLGQLFSNAVNGRGRLDRGTAVQVGVNTIDETAIVTLGFSRIGGIRRLVAWGAVAAGSIAVSTMAFHEGELPTKERAVMEVGWTVLVTRSLFDQFRLYAERRGLIVGRELAPQALLLRLAYDLPDQMGYSWWSEKWFEGDAVPPSEQRSRVIQPRKTGSPFESPVPIVILPVSQ